jgi:hypothetical protein
MLRIHYDVLDREAGVGERIRLSSAVYLTAVR